MAILLHIIMFKFFMLFDRRRHLKLKIVMYNTIYNMSL